MAPLIYNTLTRTKQEFVPITPDKVKMYVCGVTVYDYCHLGHGRAYVAFDVIYRYLRYIGYDILYVRNITDVDDKIIARANELKKDVSFVAGKYAEEFNKDMESLNVLPPAFAPKATEYIPEMIKIIEKLIKDGVAYVLDGDVYFEVAKSIGYGCLSARNTDELLAGARVEPDPRKKNPLDFSLWKKAKPGEPYWTSPWGNGRPGWHIECSAMSLKLLGEEFDIHGGGQDLIFPHHENEIAQSKGYTGKMPVRCWIHNGFVTINREKMSKSLGNFFTLKEIFEKYSPNVVRFFLISQHYRSPVDFSDKLLDDAGNALNRIEESVYSGEEYLKKGKNVNSDETLCGTLRGRFRDAMDDDFNTAKALAVVFDIVKEINSDLTTEGREKNVYTYLSALKEFLDVLGIKYSAPKIIHVDINDELEADEAIIERLLKEDKIVDLLKARQYCRKTKQWNLSDKIRKLLADRGYNVRDTEKGTDCIKEKFK